MGIFGVKRAGTEVLEERAKHAEIAISKHYFEKILTIVILIRHDHEMSITKLVKIFILAVINIWLESHDFSDILHFCVIHYLLMTRISHIEKFTLREIRLSQKEQAFDDTSFKNIFLGTKQGQTQYHSGNPDRYFGDVGSLEISTFSIFNLRSPSVRQNNPWNKISSHKSKRTCRRELKCQFGGICRKTIDRHLNKKSGVSQN
mgnify:CR=1 FL=1